jgi:hypothetical protein
MVELQVEGGRWRERKKQVGGAKLTRRNNQAKKAARLLVFLCTDHLLSRESHDSWSKRLTAHCNFQHHHGISLIHHCTPPQRHHAYQINQDVRYPLDVAIAQ